MSISQRRIHSLSKKAAWTLLAFGPWLALLHGSPAVGTPQAKAVDFHKDIEPVLKATCYQCHGAESQMGGLRLDTVAGIQKGGVSGKLFGGKAGQSLLMQRILGMGGKPRMPMGFAPLSKEQVQKFETWIAQGASLKGAGQVAKHWAYVKPVQSVPPVWKGNSWVRNPIDSFVLAKLKENGLKPSPQADKATLLRRVYLDLVGVPPTIEETNAYMNDVKPGAYERVVDRLLDSPHYGEKQAGPWLDLARYADSNGYEKDSTRTIWPYRDWVISAFNRNLPFDEFTIEQIAGDLLPNPSKDQLIATGFHRNTMANEEGGVDKGEQRWLTLVDRVGTTGSVWLGTTIACAQCHNHKYDPVSQADFYRMLAFYEPSEEPSLDLVDPSVRKLNEQIAKLEQSIPKLKGDAEAQKAASDALAQLREQYNQATVATTLIFRERPNMYPPKVPIRIRGGYLSPGKIVEAGVPSVLPQLPPSVPQNRLGLAKWLVSKENPLTARVTVNRMWESYFGLGLVKTSDDFGTQGERPIYRELLDWLACEFMNLNWDMKAMNRLIVTSNTYKQSSKVTEALREKDPENRLYARGPRFRLSAEIIRDNALAASGLLSAKFGGPSVFPEQPDGIWNSPYSGEAWVQSKGGDQYRRGVYTFWKRTAPYPSFVSFDATSRESCTTRRIRTNTPLQALALLNDEAYVGAARALATRMLSDEKDPVKRIEYGFRRVLVRRPSANESKSLFELFERALSRYRSEPGQAMKYLKQSNGKNLDEKAAYTAVAQVILNLDEAITKE